jgi:hypothetical protein
MPLLGGFIQGVERHAFFGLLNKLHRMDVFARENVANDIGMSALNCPVEGVILDRDVGE